MDDGQVAHDGHDPEDGSHLVEQSADDDQDQPLRTLHEPDFAQRDQGLRPGAGIAGHDGAHHDDAGQHQIGHLLNPGVVNQQSQEESHVGVPVQDRVEESAELGDGVGYPGHPAVQHVEYARDYDDHPGMKELPLGQIIGSQQSDEKSDKGEQVGIDTQQGNPPDHEVQDGSAYPADGLAQHGRLFGVSWLIVNGGQTQDLEFLEAARGVSPGRVPLLLVQQTPTDGGDRRNQAFSNIRLFG